MKKLALSLVAVVALILSAHSPASACDDHKNAKQAAGAPKVQTVSFEGKVVTSGCPMEAAKKDCTGTSLVVGESQHLIRKAKKGTELANKAKDTDKVVKVTGTQQGEYLTVTGYQIKG
jgi:hypothetical protein